ncbi:hypothetical protein Bca4012_036055 [Brassica carinata]
MVDGKKMINGRRRDYWVGGWIDKATELSPTSGRRVPAPEGPLFCPHHSVSVCLCSVSPTLSVLFGVLHLEARRVTPSLQRRSVSGGVQLGDGASTRDDWWFLLSRSAFRVTQGSLKPLEGWWRVEASDWLIFSSRLKSWYGFDWTEGEGRVEAELRYFLALAAGVCWSSWWWRVECGSVAVLEIVVYGFFEAELRPLSHPIFFSSRLID